MLIIPFDKTYPEFNLVIQPSFELPWVYGAACKVRILRMNKYYIFNLLEKYDVKENTPEELAKFLQCFHRQVYIAQTMYVVNKQVLSYKSMWGKPITVLDPDQTPEKIRLEKLYFPLKHK